MVTRPEGFLPTSEAVPFAFEVRATMPGKTGPHHLFAITTITAAMLTDGASLPDIVDVKLRVAALSIMESYREAQAAE